MKCPKCGSDADQSAIQCAAILGVLAADGIIVESAILAGYVAFPILGFVAGIAAAMYLDSRMTITCKACGARFKQ